MWVADHVCTRRAAKAYLQRVRAMEEADRSGSDDEDVGDRHAGLSERLRNDAMEACFYAAATVLPLHFADSYLHLNCSISNQMDARSSLHSCYACTMHAVYHTEELACTYISTSTKSNRCQHQQPRTDCCW